MSLLSYTKIGEIKSKHSSETVDGVNVKDMIETVGVEFGGFQRINEQRTAAGEQVLTPVKIRTYLGAHSVDVFKTFATHGDTSNALKVEIQCFHYSQIGNNQLEKSYKITLEGAKISSYRVVESVTSDVAQRGIEEIEFLYNKITFKWSGDGTAKEDTREWKIR